jgi:hypothetical protein
MTYLDQLLGYGIIGLGLVLAILAFRLLQSEQKQRIPRQPLLTAIYVFAAFSLLLVAAGIFAEMKHTQSTSNRAQSLQPWARPGPWTAEDFSDVLKATRAKIVSGLTLVESTKGDLEMGERKAMPIAFASDQCKVYFAMTKPSAEIDASIEVSEFAVVTAFGREPHISFGRICLTKDRTYGAVLSVKMMKGSGPFVAEAYELR